MYERVDATYPERWRCEDEQLQLKYSTTAASLSDCSCLFVSLLNSYGTVVFYFFNTVKMLGSEPGGLISS